jgi:hypothetical protein
VERGLVFDQLLAGQLDACLADGLAVQRGGLAQQLGADLAPSTIARRERLQRDQ